MLLSDFVCVILPSFPPLPTDDATRVILKSTDDYINANYINVSLFFLNFLSDLHVAYVRHGLCSVTVAIKAHVES